MAQTLAPRTNNNLSFSSFMNQQAVQKKIAEVLNPAQKTRFVTSLVSAVKANNMLSKCEFTTIISAALLGEALNLSPSPQLGHYYLVPYKNNAQFQLGYKGMIQLASRSGQYKHINVLEIKEGELMYWNPLTEEIEVELIEDENERESRKTAGYYASFEYLNGFKKSMYWSKAKMENHARKYSQAYAQKWQCVWTSDFDSMAKKTMLRQLISKWGIMSIELQRAYQADQAVIRGDDDFEYIDNQPIEAEVDEVPTMAVEEVSTASSEPQLQGQSNFWEVASEQG